MNISAIIFSLIYTIIIYVIFLKEFRRSSLAFRVLMALVCLNPGASIYVNLFGK